LLNVGLMAYNVILKLVVMERKNVQELARLVKEHRLQKKYTQQELAEFTGISLRSIQRIENAEVLPRMYTQNVLAAQLGFSFTEQEQLVSASVKKLNYNQKLVLTIGIAVLLILLACAFVFQSPTFPESLFELTLFIAAVIAFYTTLMLVVWR
jgi:transcriptional regulator with XRE-family HTH domain